MRTQIKWVRPTTQNVRALWYRIRRGQFKTTNGVPRFQVVKDFEDPDRIYLTWSYGSSALVRCSIDDFPAYLPDEAQDQATQILTRIAKRDLRPPSLDLKEVDKAIAPVQQFVHEAEGIFMDKLLQRGLSEEVASSVSQAMRETLDEMVGRKMIKGT